MSKGKGQRRNSAGSAADRDAGYSTRGYEPGQVRYRYSWLASLFILSIFLLTAISLNETAHAQEELPPWRANLNCTYNDQKYAGVEYCTGKAPYTYAHVIVVALQTPGIRFEYIIADGYNSANEYGECKDVNRASKQLGGPGCDAADNRLYYPVMDMVTARRKLPQAVVVINSDYGAGTQDKPDSREHGPEGFTVVRGDRLDGPDLGDTDNNAVRRPWLAISENSPLQAGIHTLALDNGDAWDWIYTGVGGGPWLIHNGQILPGILSDCRVNFQNSCYNNASQTAVGLSADGQWLFLVVMTGVSEDLNEMVGFMSSLLEVEEAIKLDGGGSSQLWYGGLPTGQQNIFSSRRQLSQYLGIIAPSGNGIDIPTPTFTPSPTHTPSLTPTPTPMPPPGVIPPSGTGWWERLVNFFQGLFHSGVDGFGLGSSAHLRLGIDNVDQAYVQMANMGVRWTREEIPWGEVETSPGTFSWDYGFGSTPRDFHAMFSTASQHQLSPLVMLGYGPSYLPAPTPDELVTRWQGYVQAVVDEFGDQVDYWEIGNEMNSRFFWGKVVYPGSDRLAEPDPALYARMLSTAYDIIKRHNPLDVVILGGLVVVTDGGCATNPYVYLGELHRAGVWDKFDAVGFHPYWGQYQPEQPILRGKQHNPASGACLDSDRTSNLVGDIRSLQDLLDRFGSKPIWITELGWNQSWLQVLVGYRGIPPDILEADYVVRSYVPLLSEAGVEKLIWYTQVRDAQAEDFELGEPGLRALGNLAGLLTGAEAQGQFQGQDYRGRPGDDDVHEYRFTNQGRLIVYAWKAEGGEVPRQVTIRDLPGSQALRYWADADDLSPGAGQTIPIANRQLTLELTERPVILLVEQANPLQQWLIDIQGDLENWSAELQAFIQAGIEAWIDRQIDNLLAQLQGQWEQFLTQCCGTALLPAGAAVLLWGRRKGRR